MTVQGVYVSLKEEKEGRSVKFTNENNVLTFDYPCIDQTTCTPYIISLPKGIYQFKLHGASAGIPNAINGLTNDESPCAGGTVTGQILIQERTKLIAHIGGKGNYLVDPSSTGLNYNHGGYNGGGSSLISEYGASSGGGSTDIRYLADDVFHRIIVAGAGGGMDDATGSGINTNDGRGSPGGSEEGGGLIIQENLISGYKATQETGFTFGNGEAGQNGKSKNPDGYHVESPSGYYDICGSGSGWFGGFSSHNHNGGCGGGSSFALTLNTTFKSKTFKACDEFYSNCETKNYAFADKQTLFFYNIDHHRGNWYGNGKLIITFISKLSMKNSRCFCNRNSNSLYFLLVLTA